MAHHKTLIVVGHYCPLIGGAQSVYDAMARQYPEHISVLTSRIDYETGEYVEGIETFDKNAPYTIHRLDRMRPNTVTGSLGFVDKIRHTFQSIQTQKSIIHRITEIYQAGGFDTIVVGASDAMSWLPAKLKRMSMFAGVKVIYYSHGEEVSQVADSAIIERRRQEAVRASDHIIAVSRFTSNILKTRYGAPENKIALVHNGVDYTAFAKKTEVDGNRKSDTKQVIAIGRLVKRKGFQDLLHIWPQVLKAHSEAKLMVIGEGPERKRLDELVKKLDLAESVEIAGAVDHEILIKELHASSLFVMPNRTMEDGDTEGFGLVFLEAAAAGLASIGGAYGGAGDAIIDGETGRLIDAKNKAVLAAVVIELLSHPEQRRAMAGRAKEHARRNDWQMKAQEFMRVVSMVNQPEHE